MPTTVHIFLFAYQIHIQNPFIQDKFFDLDSISVTPDNATSVIAHALVRVIDDAATTPAGNTSAAATSLAMLFFIERAIDCIVDNNMNVTAAVLLLDIVSHMKFSDAEEEGTLRMQHRALASRITEVLNATFCKDRSALDIDAIDRCYQAWVRAPACLDISSDQRSLSFAARQSLELLNPYLYDDVVRPTAHQAASLLESMAMESIREDKKVSRVHSNDIKVLYGVLQCGGVENLSCKQLEMVAGAVEHIRSSYGRFCCDIHIKILSSIVEESFRRKSMRLAAAEEVAAIVAVCGHAVSDGHAGNVDDAVVLRKEVKKWKAFYRK